MISVICNHLLTTHRAADARRIRLQRRWSTRKQGCNNNNVIASAAASAAVVRLGREFISGG